MLERCVDPRSSKDSHLYKGCFQTDFLKMIFGQISMESFFPPVPPGCQWQADVEPAQKREQWVWRGSRGAGSSRGRGGEGGETQGCRPRGGRMRNLRKHSLLLLCSFSRGNFNHLPFWSCVWQLGWISDVNHEEEEDAEKKQKKKKLGEEKKT